MAFADILEALLTPSLPILALGILIIIGAPLLLHIALASSSTYITPPTVLLLGPLASGKTSLLTLFERGTPAETHTSQSTTSVELNASTDADSKQSFRNHDDTSGTHTKFILVDTPGHGKLRNLAFGKLERAETLKAIVFVVDAAALSEQDVLSTTASYLYDVLLLLQKRAADKSKTKKSVVPVMIAANKMDLFTALPATMVRTNLEVELTRIRATRSKGLLDSGVGMDDVGSEDQDAWLGEYGSEKFSFKQMQEFDIDVDVLPGSITGEEGTGADKWWWWIAQKIANA
ncbi:putative SRP receptor beta subunit [Emericellopsis atlantica]|uniref:Signal recognition particle receptor subunit beta n=1 Tax=Emericellopsis atlantica TaxID=2614577 RepID=A0A9P8CXW9_9HYPO|nr:putative SRP receptor beta subunit [Emericellopsis atlantica]KAG9259126.1 putative SRP receptor beta subunit [Emericellopsis atlantica]